MASRTHAKSLLRIEMQARRLEARLWVILMAATAACWALALAGPPRSWWAGFVASCIHPLIITAVSARGVQGRRERLDELRLTALSPRETVGALVFPTAAMGLIAACGGPALAWLCLAAADVCCGLGDLLVRLRLDPFLWAAPESGLGLALVASLGVGVAAALMGVHAGLAEPQSHAAAFAACVRVALFESLAAMLSGFVLCASGVRTGGVALLNMPFASPTAPRLVRFVGSPELWFWFWVLFGLLNVGAAAALWWWCVRAIRRAG